jgi:anti-sigma B factor antagonist
MPVVVARNENVTVMTLSGRFDALMAKEFKNCITNLIDTRQLKIAIDMKAIDFIDSSGLGALVGSLKGVSSLQGEIRIAGLSPEVRTIFELTRLHRIFDIYENIETACAGFAD